MDKESDSDDLPFWLGDFVDKNELTDFVCSYLKKPVSYDTFKDWTFEELRAIKFRAAVPNRSRVSRPPHEEPDILPYDGEREKVAEEDSERKWLESLILARIDCPDLVPRFYTDWSIDQLRHCACCFYPEGLPTFETEAGEKDKPKKKESGMKPEEEPPVAKPPTYKKGTLAGTVELSDAAWDICMEPIKDEDRRARSEETLLSSSRKPILCRNCGRQVVPTFHGCCPDCRDFL